MHLFIVNVYNTMIVVDYSTTVHSMDLEMQGEIHDEIKTNM